ncbi:hypothetical protein BH11PSE6_BH11PSE6_16320 [soil metagenome]
MRPIRPVTMMLLAVLPASISAQTSVGQPGQAKPTDMTGAAISAGPAGRSENLIGDIDFNIDISEDQPKASAQVGGYTTRNLYEGRSARQVNTSWALKLAAPIGGKDNLASQSLLDVLSDGPELSFTGSLFGFSSAANALDSDGFHEALQDGRDRCLAATQDAGLAVARSVLQARNTDASPAEIRARALEAASEISPAPPEKAVAAAIEAALTAKDDGIEGASVAAAKGAADPGCNPRLFTDVQWARKYSGYANGKINRLLFSSMWRVGVEGGVGIKRFDFVDAASLAKKSPSKPQFRAALFGALYPHGGASAFIGRAEYQNGFESADDAIVCKPVVTDPDKDCTTGAPTPPKNIERVNFSLEYRQIFDTGIKSGDIAISPKATYDSLSDEFVAELPVYFIPKKAGNFSPGVSATYSSLTKDVGFGVFLRTSL